MAQNTQRIGWIGVGRMGYPMAERLLKAGYDVSIWNRTKSKAEPLAKSGGKIVDKPSDLAGLPARCYFHRPAIIHRPQVDQNAVRRQDSVHFPQGMDHALMGDASKRPGQQGDVELFLLKREVGGVGLQ